MSGITTGHQEAREKLTGRLFWKPVGQEGYRDAGSVREYADASSRTLVARARSERGARMTDAEQVDVAHEAWTFLLDERSPDQEELIRLATGLTATQQAALDGATATIESVTVGRWHDLGAVNVQNLRASGSLSGGLVAGTDYEVDLANGRILVLEGGRVEAGEDLTLVFDEPAATVYRSQSQQSPLFYVDAVVEEFNQFSQLFLRRWAFRGYLTVTEFPTQTGEFGVYRAKLTPSGPVSYQKRTEATSIAELQDTGPEGAAKSSSSSISSSSSSSTASVSSSSSSSSSSTARSYTSSSSYSTQSSSSSSSHSSSSSLDASGFSSSSSSSMVSTNSSSYSSASSSSSSSSSTAASVTSSSSSSSQSSESYSSSSSLDDTTYGATDAAVVAAGSGYEPSEVLSVVGGTYASQAFIRVNSTTESGAILSASVVSQGVYYVVPGNAVATGSEGGSGATFNMTWVEQ